ncbi:LysR family transcriptional regulator [uncultured Propionivibrio sp.]|uniref:LysR family transcriptional regulator n=1 Tax=uncultured Propionivibrio sp. TaxID=426737 RepID=UPI0029C08508|nr:LysR family transcriptional regulator [uncultured Propionivibrio sp.]
MIQDFNQLACFVAVAEELHFGRAAERLCMTQPPLSRQIQLLEHALGTKLFERTSRSVRLTAAGRVFLDDARRLLQLAEQAAVTAKRTSEGNAGRVVIGFTTVMGYELIPGLIAAAHQAMPDTEIVLREMVAAAQLDALENHTIDVGFLWPLASRMAALRHETIFRDPLVVAMPEHHPLAMRANVALDDLNGLPFVMFSPERGRYFYSLVNGLLLAAGVTPRYVQHLDQVLTVVGLVGTGIGVAIVPASVARFRFEQVVFRPIRGKTVVAEGRMAWRDDHQNPALKTFRSFAARHFGR